MDSRSYGGIAKKSWSRGNEVHTSPLLHHLERSTKDGTAQVGGRLSKSASEAIGLEKNQLNIRFQGSLADYLPMKKSILSVG
jgi:hypothetical protein